MSQQVFFTNVATTTGELINDSLPLVFIIIGTMVAIFAFSVIIRAFLKAIRGTTKGRF